MMRRLCWIVSVSLLLFAASTPAAPGEPAVAAADLPRVTPLDPAAALKAFVVKPGFRLELAAAEPLVVDPVAMAFDEAGRLFVVEMRDYSERRGERMGRVRLLTDTNYDGRFDTSTIYADGMGWPTAVLCYDGGIFVGCTPDILFFKDTDNDGVANERKVVFTGFGVGQERLNVQGMLNSFAWGLDNRIHGAAGLNGGKIESPAHPGVPAVDLRGKDFSFDPRDPKTVRPESGGGQHGLSFDNAGRKFVCHNSRHIIQVMYDDYYAGRNPHYAMPPPLLDIAVDGPAAEVFRLSPEEPWRVIRTQWRVAGKVSGPVEGGGRASGYFTSATGITIYRGDAFPEEYVGDAFIADVGSNLIHHKKLRRGGVALVAERSSDEKTNEFIASPDLWFRPVQFGNAPDGTLYVADMYREVVEHPWSIPESIKKHLDLNSGNDRGRIYRIVPDNFQRRNQKPFKDLSTRELVASLESKNGWHRDTAARLLYQRQDREAGDLLEALLARTQSTEGVLHAIYTLHGLGALRESRLEKAVKHRDPVIRAHAVRLSEPRFAGEARAPSLGRAIEQVTADPAVTVRYQAALSLGISEPRPQAIARMARTNPADPWIESALLQAVRSGAADLFMTFVKESAETALSRNFMRALARLVGVQDPDRVAAVAGEIARSGDTAHACELAAALAEGIDGKARAVLTTELKPLLQKARNLAASPAAEEGARTAAILLLGAAAPDARDLLVTLLHPSQPLPVQVGALSALERHEPEKVAGAILDRWQLLSPRLRDEAISMLLKRPAGAIRLLAAIEFGSVQPAELSSTQAEFLRKHRERGVRQLAARVLPSAIGKREDAVRAMQPALSTTGDIARGKAIYLERCASCHRLQGQGHPLGPDLETVKTTGREKLLINIVDPNREVPANYVAYIVETKNGDSHMGLLANETAANVTVRQAYGKEDVISRAQIARMQSQGQSLMPEGLETGLTPQAMADLLDYLEKN